MLEGQMTSSSLSRGVGNPKGESAVGETHLATFELVPASYHEVC